MKSESLLCLLVSLLFVVPVTGQESLPTPAPVTEVTEHEESPPIVSVLSASKDKYAPLSTSVTQAKFLIGTSARIVPMGDKVMVLIEEREKEEISVAILRVDNPGHVKIKTYLISGELRDAFPPKQLRPEPEGDYIIIGEPGDEYAVEVIFENKDSEWTTVSIEGDKPTPDPDPPANNWKDLTDKVNSLIPNEPEVLKVLINSYTVGVSDISDDEQFPSVNSARNHVSSVRREAFMRDIDVVKGNWNAVLDAISDGVINIQSKKEYVSAMTAVLQALKSSL